MVTTNANKTLGDTIRDARNELDLSLRELCKKLDVTPSYLSDIENNRRVPAEEVLQAIAKALNLNFDLLMAKAGRFGDDAVRYMMRTPAAGVLFRKLAEKDAPRELVEKFISKTETLNKRRGT